MWLLPKHEEDPQIYFWVPADRHYTRQFIYLSIHTETKLHSKPEIVSLLMHIKWPGSTLETD